MRKRVYRIWFWAMAVTVLTVPIQAPVMTGQQEKFLQEHMKWVKESYGFAHWKAEPGKVISGVAVSENILPRLKELQKVWREDNYSLEDFEKGAISKIRKWWRSGEEEFEVTMVVGPTFEEVKNYLIFQYAQTERQPPLIKSTGQKFGLRIGDVCFVTEEMRGEAFSTIDFIRQNVLFMLRAEGSVRYDLKTMAETLDGLLLKKKPVDHYGRLTDLPKVKIFSVRKAKIKLGEKAALGIEVDNPSGLELRYFWTLSGGGVERDLQEKFVYYGSEEGPQNITVRVVNELGLYDMKTLNVHILK